jgi:hypothetical protein
LFGEINHFQNVCVLCSQFFLFETIVLDFEQYSGQEQTLFWWLLNREDSECACIGDIGSN